MSTKCLIKMEAHVFKKKMADKLKQFERSRAYNL